MERDDAVNRLLKTNETPLASIIAGDEVLAQRIEDIFAPTDTIGGYRVRFGFGEIPGATAIPGAVNFTISSVGATSVELLLFHRKETEPYAVIPFPDKFRIGHVYAMLVYDLDIEDFEYCYRMDGPYRPSKGQIFNKNNKLLDPYAKAVTGQRRWVTDPKKVTKENSGRSGANFSSLVAGAQPTPAQWHQSEDLPPKLTSSAGAPSTGDLWNQSSVWEQDVAREQSQQNLSAPAPVNKIEYHARVVGQNFIWGKGPMPPTPMEDSIIYEMHVRGFTKHPTANVMFPGTFAGIIEKIPYLKSLGVTAVELMPIFEFDETRDARYHNGNLLLNYWGYNTTAFFAPNTSYAASAEYNEEGLELKKMIRALNKSGIEVILDVVFNHTSEGNEDGPVVHWKGIDNNVYYMLDQNGHYYNFSGVGNTVNCNNVLVQNFIINCLRYWVTQFHISGFRFDLASIMSRDENGMPMADPPLLRRIANDPYLSRTKLIAEAWDAGGMYQVGSFPAYGRWAEWNGKYRDSIRGYLKGDLWNAPEAAKRITGSADLYHGAYNGHLSSINFLTCHDGFTLKDLYTYNDKHNEANGWNNTDGTGDNRSWNCGVEGDTYDPAIQQLRFKMMRNAITVLMCSRGTPMIYAGDEFGNSQHGNNNCYCQDNELSWLNWGDIEQNRPFYDFYKSVIAFRKKHPVISHELKPAECGLPSIHVCTANPDDTNVNEYTKTLCVLFAGRRENKPEDDVIYIAINAHWEDTNIRLPALREGLAFGCCIYTDARNGVFYHEKPRFVDSPMFHMAGRSVAVFTMIKKES